MLTFELTERQNWLYIDSINTFFLFLNKSSIRSIFLRAGRYFVLASRGHTATYVRIFHLPFSRHLRFADPYVLLASLFSSKFSSCISLFH